MQGNATGSRFGLGKVRHIDVGQFWVHDKVRDGEIHLIKVPLFENLAGALTKYVNQNH